MKVETLVQKDTDKSRVCWICAGEFQTPFPVQGDNIVVDCCNCGDYKISGSLRATRFPLPDDQRYRFSYWSKQQQLERREPPNLNAHTIDSILKGLPDPPAYEKADILLRSLSLIHPRPGEIFKIDGYRQWSLAAARDDGELSFHLKALVNRGLLKQRPGPDYQITDVGWSRIGELASIIGKELRPASLEPGERTLSVLPVETKVTSHGQVGGITAHTVNVNSSLSPQQPTPPESTARWWEKWWVIVVGLATIVGAIFAVLQYFDSHPK
jgi:hypothetical protein